MDSNPSNARSGTITAGGQTFTVNQAGIPPTLTSALDTTNLVWVTDSTYPWQATTGVTHDGVDAAVSGNKFVADSISWVQTTVNGPGTIGFWWKVDSDTTTNAAGDGLYSFDELQFLVNDVQQDHLLGQIGWNYREFPIASGTNTLTWQYVKDAQFNSGNDSAWLDQVTWTPGQPITLQNALDACGAQWISDGTIPTYWGGQTNTTHDGKSAARSGTIYLNQETWMQTVVSGVSNVSFWWKVSSQTNFDFLEFYTNDILAKRISGEVNWQSNFFKIPASNTVSLKWRYAMTNGIYAVQGQEAAWVDQVTFSPAASAAPIVTILGVSPMSVECHGSFTDPGATAQDGCSGDSLGVITNGSVNANVLGAYTVSYISTNASGVATTNSRTVNVVDTTAPVVTLNNPGLTNIECHSAFADPGATAQDSCAGPLSVTTNGVVDPNTPGVYPIQYVAADPSGNTATNSRSITVVDTTPPQISINGSNPLIVECHGSFSDPGANALDDCAGLLTVTNSGSVNPNSPGAYTITYIATDPSGNSATNTRSVNVVDTTPPQITLNGTNPMTVECHSGYTEPGATASDLCAGSLTVQISGNVLSDSIGTYVVTYTASDGQNSATNTRTVNVVDTTPPVVQYWFTNLTLAASNDCHITLPDLTGTNYIIAVDSCSSVTITQSPLAGAILGLGTNQLILTASDTNGNSIAVTNIIIVIDNTPPSLICPVDVVVNVDPGQCSATNVVLGTPTVTDNCQLGAVTNDAPAAFPCGTNIVTWTAIDANGNSTNCSQVVVVLDNQLPLISAPASIAVTADPNTNVASGVNLGTPITSDNCGMASVTNDAPALFPTGTNIVTWTATDIHGNVATSTQQVLVNPAARLPHRIISIVKTGPGVILLTFLGTSNVQYVVQSSTNCFNWVPVQTNTAGADGTWTYTDSTAIGSAPRFYRSVQP